MLLELRVQAQAFRDLGVGILAGRGTFLRDVIIADNVLYATTTGIGVSVVQNPAPGPVTITGNIATEPQHKRTAAGVPITTFRVASGQRRYDRASDAWVDSETNFYSVSAFRGLAEHAFQSLRRGERVILNGRLRVRNWDNGTKSGTDVEIEADAILPPLEASR